MKITLQIYTHVVRTLLRVIEIKNKSIELGILKTKVHRAWLIYDVTAVTTNTVIHTTSNCNSLSIHATGLCRSDTAPKRGIPSINEIGLHSNSYQCHITSILLL